MADTPNPASAPASPAIGPGWHDFVNVLPPADALMLIRRIPEDIPACLAVWAPDYSGVLVGAGAWYLPWFCVTRWRIAPPGSLISAPYLNARRTPYPKAMWRDVHAAEPAREASLWVRRLTLDASPVRATWVAGTTPYFALASGWQLPWFAAWQWKPAS